MKMFDISKERLVVYYAAAPGREPSDEVMALNFCEALKSYGAQAEYLTQLINVWLTARHADEHAKKEQAQMVYRLACEAARDYIMDILSKFDEKRGYIDVLTVYRTLDATWEYFKGEAQ